MKNYCIKCMAALEADANVCPDCGQPVNFKPAQPYHLIPGTMLSGRYFVGLAIGYGGFGITYVGYDTLLERKVAIKEYFPGDCVSRQPGAQKLSVFAGDKAVFFEKGMTRFVDEAQRLAKFENIPSIVQIYDSFHENNTAYIVMELLEGKTLKAILKERGGKIPYAEAVDYVLPILDALSAVHEKGIVHRDIAPDNIFVNNNGDVKLLDFGAARFATVNTKERSLSIILKPGYAPVEQYRSHSPQGSWTDVYAMAATLYKAITGITPDESLERAAKDTLKPPSKLGVKLPPAAETAILNALNINHEKRTQTAEEFKNQLVSTKSVRRVK